MYIEIIKILIFFLLSNIIPVKKIFEERLFYLTHQWKKPA